MAQNNSLNYKPTQYNVEVGSTNGNITDVAPSATSGVPVISQGVASNPVFGTAVVAGGGTGNTTFTAYSVICAGTTATGAFQNVSGVGTANQVLTSQGASALPSWAALSSSFTITKYTASDTWTKGSNTKVVEVLIWSGGAGGASGRRGLDDFATGGGGGAAGGNVHQIAPQDFFHSTETVTIGGTAAGGTAITTNSTDGNAGTAGNISSFGYLTTFSANPGSISGSSVNSPGGTQVQSYTFHDVNSLGGSGGGGNGQVAGSPATTTTDGLAASGGGGGSGGETGFHSAGDGGIIMEFTSTYTLISAAAGGTSTGAAGANGTSYATGSTSKGWIAGGSGGGGGGGGTAATTGGTGGNGGTPGGGGGGGGGSINGANSGAGGIGARGEIWVIEYA